MSVADPRITLIVARAHNGIIGRNNQLVWRIPEELRHFRAATMGHALIVGRRTFESIGRPLPGRRMVVVSRDSTLTVAGCELANSLEAALAMATTPTSEHPLPPAEVFVAGGAQIYRQALPWATRVLITHVDLEPDGDVSFDWPLAGAWSCRRSEAQRSETGIGFVIEDWQRPDPDRSPG